MRKTRARFPGWAALVLVLAAGATAAPGRELTSVRVRLDWLLRGTHTVFFVASEKGYFQAEGLAVAAIEPGEGSPSTMSLVGSGQYEFGFGDLPSLVVARARGVPVTALAVVNQRSPMALVALRGTGIMRPRDLEGKTVGIDPAGSTYVFYRALLATNRVDRAKITETPVPIPYEGLLLDREVQVIVGYVDAEIPELEARAGGPGALEIVLGADHGYDLLGSGLVTGEALVRERPQLARAFTRAFLRAFRDVVARPREAVAILVKHHPDLAPKRDVLLRQLEADVRSTFTSADTKAHGLGWNPPGRWQVTHGTLLRLGVIEQPASGLLYTNEFLK
jgi:NitT/TauT family transport system substrate-binding protein